MVHRNEESTAAGRFVEEVGTVQWLEEDIVSHLQPEALITKRQRKVVTVTGLAGYFPQAIQI